MHTLLQLMAINHHHSEVYKPIKLLISTFSNNVCFTLWVKSVEFCATAQVTELFSPKAFGFLQRGMLSETEILKIESTSVKQRGTGSRTWKREKVETSSYWKESTWFMWNDSFMWNNSSSLFWSKPIRLLWSLIKVQNWPDIMLLKKCILEFLF